MNLVTVEFDTVKFLLFAFSGVAIGIALILFVNHLIKLKKKK